LTLSATTRRAVVKSQRRNCSPRVPEVALVGEDDPVTDYVSLPPGVRSSVPMRSRTKA
jgi:hypothetical protein